MSRFLLALFLFAFAAMAVANGPAADMANSGVKVAQTTTVSSAHDSDSTVSGQATVAPTRSSTPRPVSPRWHSLLPGMIR